MPVNGRVSRTPVESLSSACVRGARTTQLFKLELDSALRLSSTRIWSFKYPKVFGDGPCTESDGRGGSTPAALLCFHKTEASATTPPPEGGEEKGDSQATA
jgi:hypothetical protein